MGLGKGAQGIPKVAIFSFLKRMVRIQGSLHCQSLYHINIIRNLAFASIPKMERFRIKFFKNTSSQVLAAVGEIRRAAAPSLALRDHPETCPPHSSLRALSFPLHHRPNAVCARDPDRCFRAAAVEGWSRPSSSFSITW